MTGEIRQKTIKSTMATNQKISVAIIEDNKVIKRNVTKYIEYTDDMEVAHHSTSVESFLHFLDINTQAKYDILLLDIGLPGMSGLEGIPLITKELPDLDIIMLTTFEEEQKVIKALCTGAVAYISKKSSLANIIDGIRIVHQGGSYMSPSIARSISNFLLRGRGEKETPTILTPRQSEIIKELANGCTYGEIAELLSVSENTIKSHIKKLYKVLQVNNKAEAIAKFLKGDIK